MRPGSATPTLDDLLAALAQSDGEAYIGEAISQLDHALQCADLAARAGADDALVAAALLHDLGHVAAPPGAAHMDDLGVADHERIGADLARAAGLPDRVADVIEGHVDAKRWLVARRPGYAARLSDASRGTLAHQGGPMGDGEAARFEAHPCFDARLRLRAWDEAAKVVGARVPTLDSYREMLARLAARDVPSP